MISLSYQNGEFKSEEIEGLEMSSISADLYNMEEMMLLVLF